MGPILPWISSSGWWWWWCNCMGNIFLTHVGHLSTYWTLFKHHSLSIVADHVHPFLTTVHPSDGVFQQDNSPCNKVEIISNWFLVHDHEFNKFKWPAESLDLNPIENRRFASWMSGRQICSNCVMLRCQYLPKSLRNVSSTLLNLCHEELRQF